VMSPLINDGECACCDTVAHMAHSRLVVQILARRKLVTSYGDCSDELIHTMQKLM